MTQKLRVPIPYVERRGMDAVVENREWWGATNKRKG
jgi:hypothetical protein